jgi:hypothetical protein
MVFALTAACERLSVVCGGMLTFEAERRPINSEFVAGNCVQEQYYQLMSASEIIQELPKLSELDRRAIRQMLLNIANRDEDIAACNQSATEGAMMFDRLEDADASRPR